MCFGDGYIRNDKLFLFEIIICDCEFEFFVVGLCGCDVWISFKFKFWLILYCFFVLVFSVFYVYLVYCL